MQEAVRRAGGASESAIDMAANPLDGPNVTRHVTHWR
ncbi:MAG: hypothetical protein QOK04_1336 [Solirubrobacteraceae bacterium]|nr:hypothetical protein [Solirubrobacteraceae bacterium]